MPASDQREGGDPPYMRWSLFDSHYIINDLRGVASLIETYKGDPPRSGGRLKVVKVLLEHGADPRAKDRKGRDAYFYSRSSRRMARMQEECRHYQESGDAERKSWSLCHNDLTTDWATQIGFYEQIIAYDVPDRYKTVARLDRGELFPVVSAASGWRSDFAVEHTPEMSRGGRARLMRRYAEKKLVAYYVDQHVILPSMHFGSVAVDQAGGWMRQDLRLQHLATLCPRIPTVRASI
ncbi:hypothetical protein B0T24DRAFT_681864 [Lasiosphaeria ovina]|uniref:Ankyrin repeat protein n=1 Tax=Lasiosphaeria ovina TaxID=92902 RepID=A0AAE0N1H2_9PEZI|nr:hypothetical protein B0T24DRAFT_681864 [Lasiosphaeria ovina]